MAARADIQITVGGVAVGSLVGAQFQAQLATLPAAAEDAYGYGRAVPGAFGWSASGNTFLPAAPDGGQEALRDALTGRTTVAVVVTFDDGTTETGAARVQAWTVEGQVGAAVTGSFQLTGTGALTAA